jgi:peptidoglycan/LPS O-acetylase OafA/YrhL
MTAALSHAETSAPSAAPALPARLPALDGVRGVAIFAVAVHVLNPLDAPADWFGRLFTSLFAVGWIGVQLFFALSGFLITGILLDTRGATNYLSGFYARRFLRIFPLYYGALLVAFVVLPVLGHIPAALEHDRAHQLWLWTFIANWAAGTGASSQGLHHFWSLCVEEQFYILWPFVLLGVGPRACVRLCLGVAAAALAVRLGLLHAGVPTNEIYEYTVTRMDALALGGAAAAALRIPELARRLVVSTKPLWIASLAVFVVGAAASHRYLLPTYATSSFGYSFLALSCALGVLAAATSDLQARSWSPLRAAPLRALGKYSYGVYVIHKPLSDFVGKPALARLGLDAGRSTTVGVVYVAVVLAAALAAAVASFHLYESRFLVLRDRFAPR